MTSYGFPGLRWTYRRRPDFDTCPHCDARLRWVYDGARWYPCDYEPVLCLLDGGDDFVIKRGTVVRTARIWRHWMIFERPPVRAYRPHKYTCRGNYESE